jgi:hypothetical protein
MDWGDEGIATVARGVEGRPDMGLLIYESAASPADDAFSVHDRRG